MLRLSEHYVSVQGEGPQVGVLTQFVRFAGCNMRCPGWPCDTEHAINPAIWQHESEKVTPSEMAHRIVEMYNDTGAKNICLTGGEPFMQPNDDLRDMLEIVDNAINIGGTYEAFTNGSFTFPSWRNLYDLTVMMDWKLKGSGEAETRRDVRLANAKNHRENDGIKFVVKDHEDLGEAVDLTQKLEALGYKGSYWVGRVWDAELQDDELVNFIITMAMPWKLNIQIHKYIWKPDERGV